MDNQNKYYFKISPEVILNKIFTVQYPSGTTANELDVDPCCDVTATTTTVVDYGEATVYSSMTQLLSGGTNGTSTLTDLSVPILLLESAVDYGIYSVFDGAIHQKDTVCNFIFSASSANPYTVIVYNTSNNFSNFVQQSTFQLDWGDGYVEDINIFASESLSHTYGNPGFPVTYMLNLIQTSPWGISSVIKYIQLPFTGVTIDNPNGTAYFSPMNGNWANTSVSYDYIFTGDAVNLVSAQTSNNYIDTPFLITAQTASRLSELRSYGPQKYKQTLIIQNGEPFGQITEINENYTAYTIQNSSYVDFADETTIQVFESFGLIEAWMVQEPITKEEELINVAFEPEIQTSVFIDRGKNSGLEKLERLNEVDSLGDLEKYGYKFFKFN